ncbi:MAG TPA: glycerol-3-phosphate dehydrogenase/oxidase [Pirellulales bacterium]|jgi:glycerol-3-phosphate dehydrogenase|nr:glycerol-3-phosphate dehydrogenase/oxidase [Pirellulales bacterium]
MPAPYPVLILGAGINGAALARELALNGLGVVIVDERDVASGATAASSRLIHGGLRYLEHREFALVRESLAERTRLLRLAPQFVRPLRLFIPLSNRIGGLTSAARRFIGLNVGARPTGAARGLWAVRIGLSLYDAYAHDPSLPRRKLFKANSAGAVAVDPKKYRWMYAYSDAQAIYPERFALALLEDARRLSRQAGMPFRLFTYHRATLDGQIAHVAPLDQIGRSTGESAFSFAPAAIINATGAWVDRTLAALKIPSQRLIGGTKGSHFVTYDPALRDRLAGRGIYAEATDGRPIFVLPIGNGTLVGTTDLIYDDDPAAAIASPEELRYLLDAVSALFADLRLSEKDLEMHYCGVRPLPYCGPETPAAVTRRHILQANPNCAVPFFSIIGGKLTTCRSLAEETAATILARLGLPHSRNSRDRPLPGGEAYPADAAAAAHEKNRLAEKFRMPHEAIEAVWLLLGTRTDAVLTEAGCADEAAPKFVAGTPMPRAFVRWVIQNEWATTLDDIVERRLMLVYHAGLSRRTLADLAQLLSECGRLPRDRTVAEVNAAVERLQTRFGKRVAD